MYRPGRGLRPSGAVNTPACSTTILAPNGSDMHTLRVREASDLGDRSQAAHNVNSDGFVRLAHQVPCLPRNFERTGSSYVRHAIQGREHSLLWLRSGKRTTGSTLSLGSDAPLIERLMRGDEHAFLDLYDRHRRSVYRFLMHMTGSTAAAEELTQEVS